MARINIEDRFFSQSNRWKKLARLMNWPEEQAIGHLVKLWFHSQSEGEYKADADDILDWCDIPHKDSSDFLNALCHKRVRYCDLLSDGRFVIRGNKRHVDNLTKYKNRTEKGNRTKQKNKEKVDQKNANGIAILQKSHSENRGDKPLELLEGAAYANHKQDLSEPKALTITNTITNTNTIEDKSSKKNKQKKTNSDELPDEASVIYDLPILEKSDLKTAQKKTTKKTSSDKRIASWDESNTFSKCFTHVTRLSRFKAILDVPKDEVTFTRYLDDYKLTLQELEQITLDFSAYWADSESQMTRPRGRLVTWITNYVKSRNSGRYDKQKTKPGFNEYGKPKVEFFGKEATEEDDFVF